MLRSSLTKHMESHLVNPPWGVSGNGKKNGRHEDVCWLKLYTGARQKRTGGSFGSKRSRTASERAGFTSDVNNKIDKIKHHLFSSS